MATMRLSSGTKLDYNDIGTGAPIVFIHGYTGCKDYWDPHIETLSKQFQCITMDLKGHGDSEKPDGPYSIEQYAQELDEFLDHVGLEEELFLAGHSMGGMIAQQYALDYKDKRVIDGLLLMGTSPGMPADDPSKNMMRSFADMLRKNHEKGITMPEETVRQFSKAAYAPGFSDEKSMERAFQAGLKVPDNIKVELLEALMSFNVRDRLSEIDIPALVVVGDKERSLDGARELADKISDAELHIIEGVGHMLSAEAPEQITKLIEEFVSKHEEI